ncbi:hypothetical protein WJX81_000400 [Elliptochloris bilobata]|uniref:2-oxoadipate dioxygenase/decarboxylase n=1 Tax=Elliptochloris bilobata TaxID=381761 RepID=A0AAW1S3F5_9CHLO
MNSYLRKLLFRYTDTSPTAATILMMLEGLESPGSPIPFDHIAFRTYGMEGQGIASLASFLETFGYADAGDELAFPNKKLRARWMRKPGMPRVFLSEIKVEELSEGAQAIIQRYAGAMGALAGAHAGMCSATGMLPWAHPTLHEYEDLAGESEYAAWVLVNGYTLNHMTVAVHRLQGFKGGIRALNEELKRRGFELNQQGSELKVSPDGGLLQSSTVADSVLFRFADGEEQLVPGTYIEFAERAPLLQFAHVPAAELQEVQRRDGASSRVASTWKTAGLPDAR